MTYSIADTTGKLYPIKDSFLKSVKNNWFEQSQKPVKMQDFVPLANEWFKSSRYLNILGWDQYPCVDFTLGCTHFIESTAGAHNWNIQILPDDYSVYTFMGINQTLPGNLKPGVPLMISLPQWKYVDLRSDWNTILNECESKNIDIHLDGAWLTVARDIELDLSHPNIKSFAMSFSKYSADWNRCGIRWSRQRRMDSITMLNHYYYGTYENIVSAGKHLVDSIPRDYGWDKYGNAHQEICKKLGLKTTKMIHVARNPESKLPVGIGEIMSNYYDS